jgi:hypothetical protein
MKTVNLLVATVASLCLSVVASGQQALSSTEIQQIVQQVTSQPRKTWITAGTIVATHQEHGAAKTTNETSIGAEISKAVQEYLNSASKVEKTDELQKMKLDAIPFNVRYRLSNEHAMNSTVTVKYDNGRFYWEINVNSRQDSVKPNAALAGNYMTEQFDLGWNQRRIFTWDGQEYTNYSVSGQQATVDAAGKLPHVVTGPLTAGLIPWGYDRFAKASLDAAQVSAGKNANGTIDMTIRWADGTSASLTLDSAKAYAVTGATLTDGAGATVSYTCAKYQQVAGAWVPYSITVERRNSNSKNRMPTSEQWNFSSVSAVAPAPTSFHVPLAANTLVQYGSPVAAAPALYVHSNTVDTRGLLAQRLAIAASEGLQQQNCATVAVQEAAAELGKVIPDSALARLVGTDGRTSMYDMKRLAQSQGLFCRAVRTDLATLQSLQGVKAILHIPGKDHFVVLSEIDDRDVSLIDLSSNKFYYRQSIDFFPMDWSEGTALLLSDRPISSQGSELSDAALAGLVGGAGYACNRLLQDYLTMYCDSGYFGCDGTVIVYYQRWGCGTAPNGSCGNQPMTRTIESPCDLTIGECTISGEWFYSYIMACN